ncbi:MAG TPA: toxin-antitoxin system toxin subunit [Candidatus Marinimicrobia bacterium]|nr:MAG: toxin-antitoxin system toxin subunit [Candidatus Marinimicrobia bacterium CG1_02_48_14]PIZ62357.1 MAG: toxin-antitoxin system toxin subunit [Candidatus Marinimicrobia bacterium CG_4_10_14_0_2_um_filter_48_9]HCW75611.1 toxin-antitoxin system toxin subunit [Candidatus Neomarinimicrobiota bacterium]
MDTLAQILSSNVRAEFFRLLFGLEKRELHLRDIERQSGFTIGTVRQEAEKLSRLGIIIKRRDGNRLYFKANAQHPLYNDIGSIVLKTVGLGDVLREGFVGLDIQMAFIFGSIAAGTESPESDIDLFIIGNTTLKVLSKKLSSVSERLSREVNPNLMTKAEFAQRLKSTDHFITSIMNTPKLMIIGQEDDLSRLAK